MGLIVRLLHLSDLHIKSSPSTDFRSILNELIRDVTDQSKERKFDAVVFSGDLSASGQSSEFEVALELLLEPLSIALQLPREQFVLSPGNHDIDRGLISDIQERGLQDLLVSTETVDSLVSNSEEFELATSRLGAWDSFVAAFYPVGRIAGADGLAVVYPSEIWHGEMGVASVNSAWRATGAPNDADLKRLLASETHTVWAMDQIQPAPLRVVVMHHPLHWLADWSHSLLRIEFERRGVLLLTGHEHVADPKWTQSSRGSALYLPSACLFQGSRRLPIAYSIIDCEARESQAQVQIRSWKEGRHEFDRATEYMREGQERFPLPRPHGVAHSELPRYTAITRCLVNVAQEHSSFSELIDDSGARDLFDMVVEPRFFPAPFNQIAATIAIAHSQEKASTRLASFSLSNDLDEVSVAIVSGDPLSGVSNALLWLLGDRYERDAERVPVHVKYRRLTGSDPIDALIRGAAPYFGLSGGPRDLLPPLIVAFDDIELLDDTTITRFVDHIRLHAENKYLFGCHGESGLALSSALQNAGIPFAHGYLGPFGVVQLRQLVKKVGGDQVSPHVERIMGLVFDERLPRSPFLLAAIIAVLSTNPTMQPQNESRVLEAVIALLLGKFNPSDTEAGIDARGREALLQEISRHFTLSGTDRLERREAEVFVATYFDDRGIEGSASPGNHLNALISRRILIQDERGVGFRHRPFQDVVAATLMRVNRAFADTVLSDPPRYASVINHAAWLGRDDETLLNKVSDSTMPVIEDVIRRTVSVFDQLLGRGVSEYSDDQVEHMISVAAPPSTQQHIQAIEEHYDYRELTEAMDMSGALPPETGNAIGASAFLSSVLAGSELVDNVPAKLELLKRVLQGWNAISEELGAQGHEWSSIRPIFDDIFGDVPNEDRGTLWQFFMRMSLVVSISFGVTSKLAVSGLSKAARLLSEDAEVRASPALDFMATLLNWELKLPGHVELLRKMHDRHNRHLIVSQMSRALAISRYLSPHTPGTDVNDLEKFLLDTMTSSAKGPIAVLTRSSERSRLRTRLRLERSRHRGDEYGANVVDQLIALEDNS